MLKYHEEMSTMLQASPEKRSEALKHARQSVDLARQVFGDAHVRTSEFVVTLATQLTEGGDRAEKAEASELFKKCLLQVEMMRELDDVSGKQRKIRGIEINDADDNLSDFESSNGDESMGKRLAADQSMLKQVVIHNADTQAREARLLTRIGIHFRERQEYERASDLLEHVLSIKKSLVDDAMKKEAGKGEDDGSNKDDRYLTADFAQIYADLALCYQGLDELEFAQDYMAQAIQCLEGVDGKAEELADSYLLLADLLRCQD